jgi:hypothetical protein
MTGGVHLIGCSKARDPRAQAQVARAKARNMGAKAHDPRAQARVACAEARDLGAKARDPRAQAQLACDEARDMGAKAQIICAEVAVTRSLEFPCRKQPCLLLPHSRPED